MYDINNILVPIDFSDYSKKALRFSQSFAEKFEANLFLIYVIEPMVYPADFSMGQVTLPASDLNIDTRAEEELKYLVEKELTYPKDKIRTIIKTGKPFVEINESAEELDIDLIIIATHGHTGVEHMLFGSTAEKVVRKAPCPVLTIREPIKGFKFKQ
jgi:nucleotide-binding universal stress UspA family protein